MGSKRRETSLPSRTGPATGGTERQRGSTQRSEGPQFINGPVPPMPAPAPATQWNSIGPANFPGDLIGISVSQSGTFVVGGPEKNDGIITWDGSSAHWVRINTAPGCSLFKVDPRNSLNLYVFDPAGPDAVSRSTNGGLLWEKITDVLHGPAKKADLAVNPDDSLRLLLALDHVIYPSTQQGQDWTPVLGVVGESCRVAFSPASPTICYAATTEGHVYRSLSGGEASTWTVPYTAENKPNRANVTIRALACGWSNAQLVCIGGYDEASQIALVIRSLDAGETWSDAGSFPSGDDDCTVLDLAVDQNNANVIYAATSTGVFWNNGGNTWTRFDTGLPLIETTGLVLHKNTNTLYVSTAGQGAYSRQV